MIRHKLFQKSEKFTKWQVFKVKNLFTLLFGLIICVKIYWINIYKKSLFEETDFKIETVPDATINKP